MSRKHNNPQYDPNTLADKLDAAVPPGRAGAPARHDDPLIDAAARLASSQHPQLSPEALRRIQAQVLAAHDRRPRRSRRLQRAAFAFAAGLAAVIVLAAGFVPAVAASVPGDALYPVKLGVEQVEIALAPSTAAQASVHLTHAERRVVEARALFARGEFAESPVNAALDEMAAAAAIINTDPVIDAARREAMLMRTINVTAMLNGALHEAAQQGRFAQATIEPLILSAAATQASGALLLPPPPMPTLTPTFTATNTRAPTSTSTSTPGATPFYTATATQTPAPVERGGFPVAVVIDGVIEAVHAGGLTISGTTYPVAGSVDLRAFGVGAPVRATVMLSEDNTITAVQPGTAAGAAGGHPVGEAIAKAAGVPYREVMLLRYANGLGFDDIARVYLVAAETGAASSNLVGQLAQGKGWDEILQANNAAPAAFAGGRVIDAGAAATPDTPTPIPLPPTPTSESLPTTTPAGGESPGQQGPGDGAPDGPEPGNESPGQQGPGGDDASGQQEPGGGESPGQPGSGGKGDH
ncbi:MAG: hypothetical protein JXB47_01335 [Anaerolineae bacterium]|nr:hypothetical protein [Anaerolineae bacterium]